MFGFELYNNQGHIPYKISLNVSLQNMIIFLKYKTIKRTLNRETHNFGIFGIIKELHIHVQ